MNHEQATMNMPIDRNAQASTVTCDPTHLWTVYDMQERRVVVKPMSELFEDGTGSYRIPAKDGKWKKIAKTVFKRPEPVQCILVDHPSHDFQLSDGVITHNTGGGKSVLQRNVVFHVIAHAKQIKFFGIDLKRVELSPYKKYTNAVLYVATTLEDAIEVLNMAHDEMMNRYGLMEKFGVQNFLDLDSPGPALLVMVDEAGELLDASAPAKALVASTYVPNLEGKHALKDIEEGDHVLGADMEYHEVTAKYKPEAQDHYRVTVSSCDKETGASESFIAGSEHLWKIWVDTSEVELIKRINQIISIVDGESITLHNDERLIDSVITTRNLKTLKDTLPKDEWSKIRLRRVATSSVDDD